MKMKKNLDGDRFGRPARKRARWSSDSVRDSKWLRKTHFDCFFVCCSFFLKLILLQPILMEIVEFRTSNRTLRATAYKESHETKIGIRFAQEGRKLFLTEVKPSGLFGNSGFAMGMEMISINDAPVKYMKTSGKALEHIRSIQGAVEIVVRDPTVPDEGLVEAPSPQMPPLLASKSVPAPVWSSIHYTMSTELMPQVQAWMTTNKAFKDSLNKQYPVTVQATPVHVARKVTAAYHMTALHANLGLASTNVVQEANALLGTYGIVTKLHFDKFILHKFDNVSNVVLIPMGLVFRDVEADVASLEASAPQEPLDGVFNC